MKTYVPKTHTINDIVKKMLNSTNIPIYVVGLTL